MKKIAHISDVHIKKTPSRYDEYMFVFENLIESLKEVKPYRIVITGDLVHDYLDLQTEQLITANWLLDSLSKIAPVRLIRGNHDCRKKNIKRVDSIKALVKTSNNPNIVYYDSTDLFDDGDIVWAVWHHGDNKNNPWNTKKGKQYIANRQNSEQISIDLFHDPINGSKSINGEIFKSKMYYKPSDFLGDISMLGDIHLHQIVGGFKNKAYAGSLIAQDFSEGDDNFHGYLLWDLDNKEFEKYQYIISTRIKILKYHHM